MSDFISLHAERQKNLAREREKKIGHSVCTCEEQLRKAQKIKAEWHIRKASLLQCVSKAGRSHVVAQHVSVEFERVIPICATRGSPISYFTHTGTSCQISFFAFINQRLFWYIVITTNNFQFYRWSLKAAWYFLFLTIRTENAFSGGIQAVRAVTAVNWCCCDCIMNTFTQLRSFITRVPRNSSILCFKLAVCGCMKTFRALMPCIVFSRRPHLAKHL